MLYFKPWIKFSFSFNQCYHSFSIHIINFNTKITRPSNELSFPFYISDLSSSLLQNRCFVSCKECSFMQNHLSHFQISLSLINSLTSNNNLIISWYKSFSKTSFWKIWINSYSSNWTIWYHMVIVVRRIEAINYNLNLEIINHSSFIQIKIIDYSIIWTADEVFSFFINANLIDCCDMLINKKWILKINKNKQKMNNY